PPARTGVLEEPLVQGPPEATAAQVRVRRDEVAIRGIGLVRRQEPDQKAREAPVPGLGQPRGTGEVLQPQPRQQVVQLATAPPLVDDGGDPRVVGLGRASERDGLDIRALPWSVGAGVRHQASTGPAPAPQAAATVAISTSSGTITPKVSKR